MVEEIDEEEIEETIRAEIEEQIREREASPTCEHDIYKQYFCIKCHVNNLKGEK